LQAEDLKVLYGCKADYLITNNMINREMEKL